MLKNCLLSSFLYLKKNSRFSAINLAGLTLGLTVSFFALLYVRFERSYDSYHANADRIYRVVTDVKSAAGVDYRGSAVPLAPSIKDAFPEVEASTRVVLDYLIIQKDGGTATEEKIAYADSSLFSVFTFPFISGNPRKALNVPFNVVLTESSARKYFGDADPVGNVLLINGKDRAYVTGVMKDIPHNSHFRADIFVSLSTLLNVWNPDLATRWISARASTYVLLGEHASASSLQSQFPSFVNEHFDQSEFQYTLLLEPLKEIYLHGKSRGSRSGGAITGNAENLYMLSVIAAFVLLVAVFNFVNLSTAFSLQRAKEIGVRKILGATRFQLIMQFMSDAMMLSTGAGVISVMLLMSAMPLFCQLSGKTIAFSLSGNGSDIGWFVMITLIIGVMSGIYPAFLLSGFRPVNMLKGKLNFSMSGAGIRKILVLIQFAVSIILVAGTFVVFLQLSYMQEKELGFRKDHHLIVDFQFDDYVVKHMKSIKDQLAMLPGITGVSVSSGIPGKSNHKLDTEIENAGHVIQSSRLDAYFVDEDFLRQYEIEIVAGRSFSSMIASDSAEAMIINEAAVRSLGFQRAEDAVGRKFKQWGRHGLIIGVARDFHFRSFREEVQPLTFQMGDLETFMSLSVADGYNMQGIRMIETKWNQVAGGIPMTWFFADDAYDSLYVQEKRFRNLFVCFAALAMVLCSLGLTGLSAYTAAQRTKEIGIRKVLGSSVSAILVLLSRDFLFLAGMAMIVAVPVSWFSMNRWLEGFAYRITIPWWLFAGAGIIVTAAAFATILRQTLKAARVNPVRSLRSE